MARKCDTSKYRRRRVRERVNTEVRKKRIAANEAYWRKKHQEAQEAAHQAWLADPRRQLIQQLVNILSARLYANPLYRMLEVANLFGIDANRLMDDIVKRGVIPLPGGKFEVQLEQ
jgi:chromosome segregation and condensation protein ScpB